MTDRSYVWRKLDIEKFSQDQVLEEIVKESPVSHSFFFFKQNKKLYVLLLCAAANVYKLKLCESEVHENSEVDKC